MSDYYGTPADRRDAFGPDDDLTYDERQERDDLAADWNAEDYEHDIDDSWADR